MQNDYFIAAGLILAVFAVPALISALTDGRSVRSGVILALFSLGLIVIALTQKPGGYQLGEIPDVFMRVIADIIR